MSETESGEGTPSGSAGGSSDSAASRPSPSAGINYPRLYAYRHRGVDQAARERVWEVISRFLYDRVLGRPDVVLDPAAGRGEFIAAVPARERWVVDAVDYEEGASRDGATVVIGDVLSVDLPAGHFDAVFASNLLEHFATQEDVARFLGRMHDCLRPNGRIAVMGPNFRFCAKEYFDCADHTLALTHVAVEEHLYAAGFEIERSVSRFLPYSFRSVLPASPALTGAYLSFPLAWRVLGKQFLVVGRRPGRQ